MPIYEYECADCKSVFELIVSPSEANGEINCKQCGSSNVKKLLSATSHRVEGGGGLASAPPAGCGAGSPFK